MILTLAYCVGVGWLSNKNCWFGLCPRFMERAAEQPITMERTGQDGQEKKKNRRLKKEVSPPLRGIATRHRSRSITSPDTFQTFDMSSGSFRPFRSSKSALQQQSCQWRCLGKEIISGLFLYGWKILKLAERLKNDSKDFYWNFGRERV